METSVSLAAILLQFGPLICSLSSLLMCEWIKDLNLIRLLLLVKDCRFKEARAGCGLKIGYVIFFIFCIWNIHVIPSISM